MAYDIIHTCIYTAIVWTDTWNAWTRLVPWTVAGVVGRHGQIVPSRVGTVLRRDSGEL